MCQETVRLYKVTSSLPALYLRLFKWGYLSHRAGQRFTGYHCESDMPLYINGRLLEIKLTVPLTTELKTWDI